MEEQRESQISYMWEEYEITPNSALSHRKEELNDRQEMKKNISRIKDEIRRLGSVNVNAIEEYKAVAERYDAAFRRREGSDCHSPSFCYPESETVSVLSAG